MQSLFDVKDFEVNSLGDLTLVFNGENHHFVSRVAEILFSCYFKDQFQELTLMALEVSWNFVPKHSTC